MNERRIGGACVLLVVLTFAVARGADEGAKRPELTTAQKKQLQLLVSEFRKARTVAARVATIDKAAEIDPTAVEPLAELVAKELHKELAPYRQQFLKAAAAAAGARVNPSAVAEVTEPRAKVLELTKREGLTKEAIV